MRKILFVFLFFLISLPIFAADQLQIAVLLDTSKSVPASEFAQAKEIIRQIIDRADSGTNVTLYSFGTDLKQFDPKDLNKMQALDSYTMVYDAAYDAAQALVKAKGTRKAILVFSDGYDTKSVTTLEDIVSHANQNGIALYGIGVGKANRKVLERMAKLTGGKYFDGSQQNVTADLTASVSTQKQATSEPTVAQTPVAQPVPQQQPAPAKSEPASQPAIATPAVEKESSGISYLWWVGVFVAVTLVGLFLFVVARSFGKQVRTCPTCGKRLEAYQTICPDCSAPAAETRKVVKPVAPQDGTQELKASVDSTSEEELIPVEWLERKPVTEEMLSKTFVLMETPMLVVRKGKNLGQTFSLNRAFPVSIGRSRVNEIRLDDVTVSSQHCRIIPENGKHVLCDLGSTNGTFLNDKKVERQMLKEGDTIRVGETQFLYKIEQHRN